MNAKVEIQIRTIAMDFWASLEHKMYYKFEGNAPASIRRELKECAALVAFLDQKMLAINEGHIHFSVVKQHFLLLFDRLPFFCLLKPKISDSFSLCIRRELKECADLVAFLDQKMLAINEEILSLGFSI